MWAYLALLTFLAFIVITVVVLIRLFLRYDRKPDNDLEYARLLLSRVLWADSTVPVLPEGLKQDIEIFMARQHKELRR